MQPDHSVKIEEILMRYEGRAMTPDLHREIMREIMPLLGDLSQHLDRRVTYDRLTRGIDITLKAKTPLGKMLLDRIGENAKESS